MNGGGPIRNDPITEASFAAVGTGGMAQWHLSEISSLPNIEVVGLSDSSADSLSKVAQKYPQALAHVDTVTMLRKSKPDIVSIYTPNKFHCSQTLAALSVGAHVLCKKPMAMTLAEAHKMEDARAKAGKIGMINFSYRNVPSFRFAREIIARGELEKIMRINAIYLQSFLGRGRFVFMPF